MATRTEKYFLALFDSTSLRTAVERAAQLVRASAPASPTSTVDVFTLAEKRGLRILEDLSGAGCPEGKLLPRRGGFTVRLKCGVTAARKRFSLAHELGHSFFYQDDGSGPRHVIGVLDSAERTSEERICDYFAECLLLPVAEIKRQFQSMANADAGMVLAEIDRTATTFSVSPHVVVSRLQSLEIFAISCLIVCSSLRPSSKTPDEPSLRVDFCAALGTWQGKFIWKDRGLRSIGLSGPVYLYEVWSRSRSPGAFSLKDVHTLVSDAETSHTFDESVKLSTIAEGRWKTVEQSCVSASRLYSWRSPSAGSEAYVVSVVAPS